MGLALVHGRARAGVRAPAVKVEVHLAGGLPAMSIVGLPEAAVREAKDRVRAAIQCAQFEFPARRITVNLAPADLPKGGGRFDLPIALGILAASGQLPQESLRDYEFIGELGLTGELRPVDGVLPAALAAAQAGRRLVVPEANGAEAALASGLEAFTARTRSRASRTAASGKPTIDIDGSPPPMCTSTVTCGARTPTRARLITRASPMSSLHAANPSRRGAARGAISAGRVRRCGRRLPARQPRVPALRPWRGCAATPHAALRTPRA